jgi:hypothetical protein
MNLALHARNKVIWSLIFSCFPVSGHGDDGLSIKAFQMDDSIEIRIENTSKETAFIGNPEKCKTIVVIKTDDYYGGFDVASNASNAPWKHIVILAPKNEDGSFPHDWSWSFVAPLTEKSTINKMSIHLWYATERDFKNNPFTSLKLREFSVAVKRAKKQTAINKKIGSVESP